MTQLSDELLTAYIDGQLDKPQAAAVTRLSQEDYDIAQRIQRLQLTQARLIEAFGGLMRKEQTEPLDHLVRIDADEAGRGGFWRDNLMTLLVAAICIATLATYGLSRQFSAPDAPPKIEERLRKEAASTSGFAAEVAKLHSFFSRDSLTGVKQTPANRDLIAVHMTRFVRGLTLPDFTKQGFTLARAQMLDHEGGRFMQLAYLGREEQPVALYVKASAQSSTMEDGELGKVKTVSWAGAGAHFVLAGSMPQEALRALAIVAQSQISPKS